MGVENLVLLCGTVSSDPKRRELPSGSTVTNVEVTTRGDTGTASVPVVVHDRDVDVVAGDGVVVVGHVQRRFFRAGGVTQSRTEVVAARIVPSRRTRTVERTLREVAATLGEVQPDG